jgi:N-acetylglucosamine-6-phosphate deacetylase
MSGILTARRLLERDRIVEHPVVTIEDGVITAIRSREAADLPAPAAGSARHDFPDAMLVPAYIDIHIHGAAGHDVMEGTPQALHAIGAFLARHGIGAFFPTTVTSSIDKTLLALEALANQIEREPPSAVAVPLGIHLEGPFLSHKKRGVHPASLLRPPSISLFDRFWAAAQGHIRLMTIAPELEDAPELIEHAAALGVRCSLGHSDASSAQAEAAFRAGARSATHTFNAMRALGHRDPGLAAYVLDNDDLYADIICDGIHVDPLMIRLFFKAKGAARAILITDSISAAGMPEGRYKLGALEVEVENGRCTLAGPPGGVLAGSVLTLDLAVRNFARFTDAGFPESVGLATRNPARLVGLEDRWGTLEEGRQADIAVLSPSGEILQTFRAGHPILD